MTLGLDEATVARFCESRHIRRLALFGSQLKGTARRDSDADLRREDGLAQIRAAIDAGARSGPGKDAKKVLDRLARKYRAAATRAAK